jgi:hypothetical protein
MKLVFKALEEQDDEMGKMDAMRRYTELTAALSNGHVTEWDLQMRAATCR